LINNCKAHEKKRKKGHQWVSHIIYAFGTLHQHPSGLSEYGLRIHVEKILIGKEETRVARISQNKHLICAIKRHKY